MKNLEKIFDLALDELVGFQKNEGFFKCVSSVNQSEIQKPKEYRTIFQPALILLNISEIENEKLDRIKKKLSDFLLKQKSDDWSFNYWIKKTEEEKKLKLPDDLDDTFVALAALQKSGYKFTPKDYAKITNLLVDSEDKVGGPYRTWLVGRVQDKRWLEVDLAVNINIAYFLALNQIRLPKLEKYIEEKIISDKLESKYYPNIYSVIYFLARFYRGNNRQKLIDVLLKRFDEKNYWGSCLDTSLAVSALINLEYFGREVEAGIKYLLDQFDRQGWQWAGFCLDPMIGKEKYFNGSKVLTYSFCLQAINQYKKLMKAEKLVKVESGNKITTNYCQKVFGAAVARIGKLGKDFRKDGQDYLKKYQKKDEDGEIVLLPLILAQKAKKEIDRKIIFELSLANLYGWMAYTIYDDFLDDEGEKKYLPLANLWLREVVNIYRRFNIGGLNEYFNTLMDEMEGANNWEVKYCRFAGNKKFLLKNIPDFGKLDNLASKSIGHGLSGVAILLSQGVDRKIVENYLVAFRNYLIARQLNDDAHDWEDDLRRGQINAVGAMVLSDWQERGSKKEVDLKKDLEKLQVIFWEKTIKEISRIIFNKVDFTKKKIIALQSDLDLSILNKKLDNLKNAARRSIEESREAREFMEGF